MVMRQKEESNVAAKAEIAKAKSRIEADHVLISQLRGQVSEHEVK